MKNLQEVLYHNSSTQAEHVASMSMNTIIKNDIQLVLNDGLIGFSEQKRYNLHNFADIHYAPLRMLLNCDQKSLSFIIIEMDEVEDLFLREKDLTDAPYEYLNNKDNIGCFFIVTIRKTNADLLLTANTRAPLFIDYYQGQARQHILTAPYDLAYPLYELSMKIRQHRHKNRVLNDD